MATYSELMAKAQKLIEEAQAARQAEIAGAITEIKAKMAEYGISVQDLQTRSRRAPRASKGAAAKAVRIVGPDGQVWTGGRGRKPNWVKQAEAAQSGGT